MNKILKELNAKTSEEILKNYGDDEKLPIDIVGIVRKIGIKLGCVDFSDLESKDDFKKMIEEKGHILGAVFPDGENINLLYRFDLCDNEDLKDLSDADKHDKLIKRQRFTIAHELAHCCLHAVDLTDYHIEYRTEQQNYTDEKERQANIFAGELLIPKSIIVPLCAIAGDSGSVAMFADLFKVSRNVMKARLTYLLNNKEIENIKFAL